MKFGPASGSQRMGGEVQVMHYPSLLELDQHQCQGFGKCVGNIRNSKVLLKNLRFLSKGLTCISERECVCSGEASQAGDQEGYQGHGGGAGCRHGGSHICTRAAGHL